MRIQRQTRRSNLPYIGIGCATIVVACLIIALVGFILLLPRLSGLTLQIAGFQSRGSTNAVFADATPLPPIQVQDPVVMSNATIELGSYGTQALDSNLYDYTLTVGNGPSGEPMAVATFTETSLMTICTQRTTVCSRTGAAYRNGRIDLRPGGAVIYADVYVPQLGTWQNLGVVMHLDTTNRQFQVRGVDLNGTLYEAPPTELGKIVGDIEQTGNDILRQMVLSTGGVRYRLAEMRIDDQIFTLIMR